MKTSHGEENYFLKWDASQKNESAYTVYKSYGPDFLVEFGAVM
jgi:hypothetical protein